MPKISDWWMYHRLMQDDLEIVRIVPDDDNPFVLRFSLNRPLSDKERDILMLHGLQLDPRCLGTGNDGLSLGDMPNGVLQADSAPGPDAKESTATCIRRVEHVLDQINDKRQDRHHKDHVAESEARTRDAVVTTIREHMNSKGRK